MILSVLQSKFVLTFAIPKFSFDIFLKYKPPFSSTSFFPDEQIRRAHEHMSRYRTSK